MSLNENQISKLKEFFFGKLDWLCETTPEFKEFLKLRDKRTFINYHLCSDWGDYGVCPDGVHFHSGETKVVICFDDENREETNNWVVKIPFLLQGLKFDDYCRIEVKNYLRAIESEVDDCFAPMYFLGNYTIETAAGNFYCPIYIMERVEVDQEKNASYAYDTYNEDEYGYCEDFDGEEGARMCLESSWSSEIVEMLEDFLCEYDINDVHAGNIGVNKKGQYVICDYSGY